MFDLILKTDQEEDELADLLTRTMYKYEDDSTIFEKVEASSNDEIGKILRSIPFWGMVKWKITPLQSLKSALDQRWSYSKDAFRTIALRS